MRLVRPGAPTRNQPRLNDFFEPRACRRHCSLVLPAQFRPSGRLVTIIKSPCTVSGDHSEGSIWSVYMHFTCSIPKQYPDVLPGEGLAPGMIVHEHVATQQAGLPDRDSDSVRRARPAHHVKQRLPRRRVDHRVLHRFVANQLRRLPNRQAGEVFEAELSRVDTRLPAFSWSGTHVEGLPPGRSRLQAEKRRVKRYAPKGANTARRGTERPAGVPERVGEGYGIPRISRPRRASACMACTRASAEVKGRMSRMRSTNSTRTRSP